MNCLLCVLVILEDYLITSFGQVLNSTLFTLVENNLCHLDNHSNVEKIIQSAVKYDVCVIPFGGGTNVSGALECPMDEKRTIVSLDMTQMVSKKSWPGLVVLNKLSCK